MCPDFPTFAHDTSTACSKQGSEKTGKETARTVERINWPTDSDENKGLNSPKSGAREENG